MDRRDLRVPLLSSENDPGVSLAMPPNLMSPSYTLHKSGCSSHSRLLGKMDLQYASQIGSARSVYSQSSMSNMTTPTTNRSCYEIDYHDDPSALFPFEPSEGISSVQAAKLLGIYGRNELPEKVVPKWYIFVSQLWQPMPIMIWAAAIIELCINDYLDMGILLFIQFLNASIGYYEITKAGDAVAALKQQLKGKAYVKRDGRFQEIDAALLVPGDLISLGAGSAVPADCRTNCGIIEVDQAALTGESLPVVMHAHDECRMGSTVARGETEATVTATGANTFFGKTATLLGQNNETSNFQKMLLSIVTVLVILTVGLSAGTWYYLTYHSPYPAEQQDILSFVVVLVVAAIPMAVEIVTTTTLAVGSKSLAKEGAIVTRLAAIEDLAGMAILCSDKTGTLTLNKMVIQEETPIYAKGESQYSLLRYAAMAAKWNEPPKDALDTLILTVADIPSLRGVEQLDFLPFDPIVKRTEGTIKEIGTGKKYKTTKGAPHVILKLVQASNPDDSIVESVEDDVHALGLRGIRSLAVAKTNDEGKWEMLGLLTFLDPPRPDTKQTIEDANKFGVVVKMITGDHLLIAKETARVLGMGNYMCSSDGLPVLDAETKKKPDNLKLWGDQCLAADGFAEVFPEHKFLIVECLRELGYKVGMTGDGVNDAPALKRADVGVAVSGATDAARAAADIFLTQPGLTTIVNGIVLSREIFARIRNFLIYRIAASFQLLLFFVLAAFIVQPIAYQNKVDWQAMPKCQDGDKRIPAGCWPDGDEPWPAFFHIPVFMLILITLLNDGTLISIGYDSVTPSKTPEKWNRSVLFTIASVLSIPAIISNLMLLDFLLDSWNPDGMYQKWTGSGTGISYGTITTAMFLKVGITDILTIFSARTGNDWFFSDRPANILLGAALVSMCITTVVASYWPSSNPDGIETIGLERRQPHVLTLYTWFFCIMSWLVQDILKVAAGKLLTSFNVFGINNTGQLVMPQSALDYKKRNMPTDNGGLAHDQESTSSHSNPTTPVAA